MEKRILSVCLTACMLLTLMPSAFAADTEQTLPIAGMEQTEETSADARTAPWRCCASACGTGARAHRGGKGHAGGALHYGSRL